MINRLIVSDLEIRALLVFVCFAFTRWMVESSAGQFREIVNLPLRVMPIVVVDPPPSLGKC